MAARSARPGGAISSAALKKLVGMQDIAPASLNAMYDSMLEAAQSTIRATDAAARRMQREQR